MRPLLKHLLSHIITTNRKQGNECLNILDKLCNEGDEGGAPSSILVQLEHWIGIQTTTDKEVDNLKRRGGKRGR